MTPDLVRAFESAVNAVDVDAAAALVTDDVEVGGPRGAAHGVDVLRQWVSGSGISLTTVRFFGRDDVAVALQDARWIDDDTTRPVATEFATRDGRISRIVRHDSGLDDALTAAGLSEADEIAL
ncbi:nuclear transport factor 2 family protein [Pseudonocardia sp. N23]|uniref:nuclear transport factor 2 family protein n=1 Tax=Pseudonocardia sp. N23 TaxID=1987376 RepID=UPI000C023662|nr:nuclear transport factor 2 family protein [Pseudonocardia sp. N23]GAY10269.1 hypothetical protein TOK_4628 [Pseudonocardia sp. N23]